MRNYAVDILKDCFPIGEPIYSRRIRNEYCHLEPDQYKFRQCCDDWLIVTTKIGHIKIGWRKRVINIDWSDTDNKTEAEKLFPKEDTTKFDCCIHAWGYEKAKEYLNTIINERK